MKEYAVSDLVKEVKVILDRNQETAEMIPGDTDTLSQGQIIRSVIADAAKTIEELAPISKLGNINKVSAQATWAKDYGAYVGQLPLPSNMLRLVNIKVSGWKRPGTIVSESDDEYLYQQNQYVRGNPQRPIAALTHVGGVRVLELYTSDNNNAIADLSYVSEPEIDASGNIELCVLLKDAILYMAAYLACISLGDTQTATGFKETAYQLAGIVEPSQTQ